jgi:hypothetical protein
MRDVREGRPRLVGVEPDGWVDPIDRLSSAAVIQIGVAWRELDLDEWRRSRGTLCGESSAALGVLRRDLTEASVIGAGVVLGPS